MDGLKDVMSFLGALFGLISALIPLLGYLADKRRRASTLLEARTDAPRVVPTGESPGAAPLSAQQPMPVPRLNRAAFEKAEARVRTPAIFMIVVGALSLTTNFATAGIGFIDEFIVPLGIKPAPINPLPGGPGGAFGDGPIEAEARDSDRRTTVLGIIGILFFSFASAIAVWSGYSMLKLRNYWLALAGSVALVPGSCMCCLLGIPSGVWSLVVLLDPDVRAAFH